MNKDRGRQGDNIPRAEMKARPTGTLRLLQRDAITPGAGLLSGEHRDLPVPSVRHSMGLTYWHWKQRVR